MNFKIELVGDKVQVVEYIGPKPTRHAFFQMEDYCERLKAATRYSILPEHKDFWLAKQGEVFGGECFEVKEHCLNYDCTCRKAEHCHSIKLYATPVTTSIPRKEDVTIKDYQQQILEIIEDEQATCKGSNEANIGAATIISNLINQEVSNVVSSIVDLVKDNHHTFNKRIHLESGETCLDVTELLDKIRGVIPRKEDDVWEDAEVMLISHFGNKSQIANDLIETMTRKLKLHFHLTRKNK